jgi:uncharacterized protein
MNYAANRTRSLLAIALAIAMTAAMASAALVPSLDEVYRTARSGDLSRADAMMQQVLSAYPNSARAHYAYAQILAAEGRTAAARSQLNRAEQIAPGLPFVSPQALASLEGRLQSAPTRAPAPRHSHGSIPWLWLLVGGGIVWFLLSRMRRRAAYQDQYRNAPYPSQNAPAGYSYGAGPQPYAGGGGSWWSSIMSGLGFGAGAAAGQYAADRFLHRGDDQQRDSQIGEQPVIPPDNAPDNLGGDDFGIGGGNQASGGWTDSGADQSASGGEQPAGNDSDSAFGMSQGDGNDGGWDDSSGGDGGTDV